MLQLRPAEVLQVNPPSVQVRYLDFGNTAWLVRPSVSGLTTGYHWMPAINDRVIIGEWPVGNPFIICGLSVWNTANAALLPNLQPSEQAIYGPTGQVLKLVAAGDVTANAGTGRFVYLGASGAGTGALVARLGDAVQVVVPAPTWDAPATTVTGAITSASTHTYAN